MIAQIGLSILLAGVLVYAWSEYRRAPVISILSIFVATAGLYLCGCQVMRPGSRPWLALVAVSISLFMSGS
jgi:hypothetical protein